jgi:hypothetical protein
MVPVTTRTGVQIQDVGALEAEDFALANVKFLDCHLADPGRRTVRVRSFYRLNPGDVHYRNAKKDPNEELGGSPVARDEGRHRHSWEKILLDLQLPLPDSGLDPLEPISGWVRYHPEGVFYSVPDVYRKRVGPDDRVIVHCHVHTEGSEYTPLQTLGNMREQMEKINRQRPGEFPAPDGDWYLGFDGVRVEESNPTQAKAWEEWQQRRLVFKESPIADDLIRLYVNAFPWYEHPSPGVKIKPIAAFNAMGPITVLLRLEAGSKLPSRLIRDHRMMAVMAGDVRVGDDRLKELTVAYGSPGDEFPPIVANERSLLWSVRWMWKDNPVADFWLD